ncbi:MULTISPECIES: Bax inhibitor-1/YccA family protein [Rhodococcus]|uniref:Putative YccA/Bax inhibitor family protein n=1 Tax=Nocardia globerula TaxID=1818 RepID=A0A652YSZ5_NOCGL|nr:MULTISPECIES: Bax inhibitor-1/YccA family protein [Rhodococcus]KJF21481.1 putative membrane protein [Rhodococcus sp. AD45]PVX66989.1 putative YccA/Bax inhibitor family protein [Rhodococcus globerulus]QXW02174.1 Bax inhibitor-1/YccA family protein [Rhodococcus globerulus]
MRTTSNPVFRNLPKQEGNGYASFGSATAGASQVTQQFGQPQYAPAEPYQTGPTSRAMTIDDVVTKTGMTLGVLALTALVSYFLVNNDPSLASPFVIVGGLVGLVLVLVATFGRKMDNPAIVLAYAAFEGLFLGALSFMFTAPIEAAGGVSASVLISQAVLGTFGVFFGMLVVYKTGAIRVTPRLTRMIIGALIGVVVLALGNLVASFFIDGGLGLRDGGPIAIIFSLVCIGLAAFSFLLDFDAADQLIRAQAPEKAAWGVALGLTVTLVWLYVEILRLLSYFSRD